MARRPGFGKVERRDSRFLHTKREYSTVGVSDKGSTARRDALCRARERFQGRIEDNVTQKG